MTTDNPFAALGAKPPPEEGHAEPLALPDFVGTGWPTEGHLQAYMRPGAGRPWQKTWAEMEALLTAPGQGDCAKDLLPLWNLSEFREKTEAEAQEEYQEKLKVHQQRLAAWTQKDPGKRAKKAPEPERPPEAVTQWGPNYRSGATLVRVHGLALDLDNPGNGTPEQIRKTFDRWGFMAHTSYSHTPGAPAWRVFLPLSKPVDRKTGERLHKDWAPRWCARYLKLGSRCDTRGKFKPMLDARPPEQGMFVPCNLPDYRAVIAPGRPLDPDEALAELSMWEQAEAETKAEEQAAEAEAEAPPRLDLAPKKLSALLPDALKRMERRRNGEEKPIPVPFPALAKMLYGGLWQGLSILVGNTGSGKTQLSLALALHAAREGIPTAYIGLELDELGLCSRMLGLQSGARWSDLYLGKELRSKTPIDEAATILAELPLYLDFAPPHGWSYTALEELAEALRAEYPEDKPGARPTLIILDFLQLVTGPEGERQDLRERIGRAAYAGRAVARAYGAHVMLISSTARDKYNELSGKPPRGGTSKSKIDYIPPWGRGPAGARELVGSGKESGEIEYAADMVLVLCQEPWETNSPPEGGTRCHLAVAKQRPGGPGWVPLRFDGSRFRGEDEAHVEAMKRDNGPPPYTPPPTPKLDL